MEHLQQIAEQLSSYGIDAMLLTSTPGELYATGFYGEGTVVVTKKKSYYFTDSRYIEAAEKAVTGAVVRQSGRGAGTKALVQQVMEQNGVKRLGFEDGCMTVAAHLDWAVCITAELVPAQGLTDELRAAKDTEELSAMRQAQRITDEAFSEILNFIRVGMTEQEIAARLVYEQLCRGAQKMSFDPIVVTGPNGSLPHGIPGERQVEKGFFVTMDFGCVYRNYCSDMTRTVAIGKVTEEMEVVYHTVLKAQLAGIKGARAGMTGREIDATARAVIEQAGFGSYFSHSFGHSLGLEIHEKPNAAPSDGTVMPVGAVISAEPGIYLPGRFGVRIEDVIILQETGNTDITRSPKELIVL